MNIYDYLRNYGGYTFAERKLNEIDATILSFLSYVDFSQALKDKTSLTIQEAGKIHFETYDTKERNMVAIKEANKLLKALKDTNRYKNCILSHYEYIGNDTLQLGVVSIEYEKDKIFISFEGTDSLFSGWKEDFLLSSEFPTISHKLAIKYINRHYKFTRKQFLVGGHSKGGNLALVSSMYCSPLIRYRIKKVYNIDGPGLLDKQQKSNRFNNLRRKYIHIIPNHSIIGILLNHCNDRVVKSKLKGLLAHNIANWEVDDNRFKRTNLSTFSKELDRRLLQWVRNTEDDDKREIVRCLNQLFQKANVKSILELKDHKRKFFELITNSNEISEKAKIRMKELVKILIKSIETTKKDEFKSAIASLFKFKQAKEG